MGKYSHSITSCVGFVVLGIDLIQSYSFFMYTVVMKFPKWVLLFCLLALVGAIFSLPDQRLEMDFATQRDLNLQSVKDFNQIEESFGRQSSVVAYWYFSSDLIKESQCKIHHFLTSLTNESTDQIIIQSPWTVRGVVNREDFLAFPPLVQDPCADEKRLFEESELTRLIDYPWLEWGSEKLVIGITTKHQGDKKDSKEFFRILKEIQRFSVSKFPESNLYYSGPSSFRYYLFKTTVEDSWVGLLALVLLMALLYLYFGSSVVPATFMFLVLISFLFTFGLTSFFEIPASFLVNGLILILLISLLSDFVFIFSEASRSSWEESFYTLWKPSFYTSLTTVVGFLSLLASDFSLIRNFGVTAAIGAVLEWLVCFLVLPCLVQMFPKLFVLKNRKVSLVQVSQKLLGLKVPRFIARSLFLVAIAGLPAFLFLKFHDEPTKNFPNSHPLRIINDKLSEENKSETSLLVQVPPELSDSGKSSLKERILSFPNIVEVFGFEDLIKKSLSQVPEENKDLVRREIELTQMQDSYLTSLGYEKWVVSIKNYSSNKVSQITQFIRSHCSNCAVSGYSSMYAEVSSLISASLISSFSLSLLLVGLVIGFIVRKSFRKVFLQALVSILFGPFFLVFVISIFQIPVNIVTSVFFAVVVALTGDNFIQYFLSSQKQGLQEGMNQKGGDSLFIAVCLSFVSAVFLLQTLMPLKILGGLFAIGFLVNFLGDFFLLKYFVSKNEDPI